MAYVVGGDSILDYATGGGDAIFEYVIDGGCAPCVLAGRTGARAKNVADPADVELLLGDLTTTTSECAEDVAHAAGTPCATNRILKTVAAFAASTGAAEPPSVSDSPLLPSADTPAAEAVRVAAAALGCASESCVLAHPSFRAFARDVGVSGRDLALELELRYKTQGPRNTLELTSNFNLDGTLQRWARVFPEFYPCPFAMMDFDTHGDLFGEIDLLAVLDGRVAMDLGPGVGRLARPATCFGCIVNTDTSNNRGKHWVAVFVDCRSSPWSVEYFNSAGAPPPRAMTNWMQKSCARLSERHETIVVAVTDLDHQESQTECGLYALYYIRRRLEGTPYSFFFERLVPDAAMTAFRLHVFRAS